MYNSLNQNMYIYFRSIKWAILADNKQPLKDFIQLCLLQGVNKSQGGAVPLCADTYFPQDYVKGSLFLQKQKLY